MTAPRTTQSENEPRPGLEDRLQHFQNLMPHRVRRILLVASPYDSFLLEEEGQLDGVVLYEFVELNLRHAPAMRRVATGSEALAEIRRSSYDLVISTDDMGSAFTWGPWTLIDAEDGISAGSDDGATQTPQEVSDSMPPPTLDNVGISNGDIVLPPPSIDVPVGDSKGFGEFEIIDNTNGEVVEMGM